MSRPVKILHVLRSARAEGTVKLALDLMRTVGAEHSVLILEREPADLTRPLGSAARSIRIERALPRGPAKHPWMLRRVYAACRQERPDLVICWPNGFGGFVLLGAALAGVRGLITHAGNPPTPTTEGRLHTWFTAIVIWVLRARMICCSQYVAREFARAIGGMTPILAVVYNCVPAAAIGLAAAAARAARSDRRPRIIMVATLERHKDHATLLRAMPLVRRAEPEAELWLAGDGSLRESLLELHAKLELGDGVRFLGSRPDVPVLLGSSDVFAFATTLQEGLGTVLVEALAAGLSVVASDVPACREALGDGRWGRLVPPRDAAALANALVAALRTARRPEWEERRRFLERHAPERMMAGYLAALN